MAGDKREVRVAVVGDASQLQRELLKAEGKLNTFGDQARTAGDTLRSALFGGAVLYGAKQLVDAASNLQQAIGGTAAVFEQASGPVNDFAKDAANLAGLSEEAARSLTSRLGASLKGFGLSAEEAAKQSVFLTQTGADLAATLGGTTDEAVTALGAALRGEYDPLERFGIALKASDVNAKAVAMGLADSEASVSTYAKGQAALALITEKSAFAQGQFAKESDTAAGQAAIASAKTKNASADLGKALLPIYTKIQEVVAAVAEVFSALPGPVQTGVIALTAVALVGPKIYSGITAGVEAIRALPAALEKAALSSINTQGAIAGLNASTQAAGTTATGAAGGLALLGPAAIAVGAAAVVGGLAWKSYSDRQAEAKKLAKELGDALDANTGKINDQTTSFTRQRLEQKNQIDNLSKAAISVEQYTVAIGDNSRALALQESELRALAITGKTDTDYKRNLIKTLREEGGARNDLIATLAENDALDSGLLQTILDQTAAYDSNLERIKEQNIQKGLAEGKTRDLAAAEAALKSANEEAAKAIKANADAIRAATDPYFKLYDSVLSVNEAQKNYNDSVRQYGTASPQAIEASKKLAEAGFDYLGALSDLAIAQANGTASAEKLQQQFKLLKDAGIDPNSAAMQQLQNAILAAGSAAQYVAALDPVIRLRLDSYQAIVALEDVVQRIEAMKKFAYSPGSYNFPGRWTGGTVDQGSPYIVGEKGPELFVPSSYGRIMDAFSTSKAMLANMQTMTESSTSPVNVYVNQSDASPYEIGRELVWAMRVTR